MMRRDRARVLLISLLLGAIFVGAWQAAVVRQPKGKGLPGPAAVAVEAWQMVRHPFYDNGPNDKGIGLQLGASLGRLRATGLRPKFLEKMEHSNVRVDPRIFAMDRD